MNQAHSIADLILSDKGANDVNTSKIGLAVAVEVHKPRHFLISLILFLIMSNEQKQVGSLALVQTQARCIPVDLTD